MRRFLALCLVFGLLAGCTGGASDGTVLHVLASSELRDMEPLLADLQRETGISLVMDYQGTIDASNALTPGDYHHDLAWLSSDRVFRLKLKKSGFRGTPPPATSTMLSPVVVGVKPETAALLRKTTGDEQLSWADFAARAAEGLLRFGMADPRSANSGMAALVGVATAAAGGVALQPKDITCDRLRGLLSGQTLSAETTSQLLDAYVGKQDQTDALISYESSLLELNNSGKLHEPLEIIHPKDGAILSDYPLLLLNPAQRAAYDKVAGWLTSGPVQQRIMERTLRRPIDPQVPRVSALRADIGNSLYFPDDIAVVDSLVADFADPSLRAPDHVVFVLDFSKSMQGKRIDDLRAAFAGLAGADTSASGKFVRFYRGEQLSVLRFAGHVLGERDITVGADPGQIAELVAADDFGDQTAIWAALGRAYQTVSEILRTTPDPSVSVVLMTDGENNAGPSAEQFLHDYAALPDNVRRVHTYAVRFGEADPAELGRVASATGGHLVDATGPSLLDAFKEIRGCH